MKNIENVQILTGTPDEVEKKVEAYCAENSNARVLGTALAVHRAPKPAPDANEGAKPTKKTAKKAAKNAANAPKEDEKAAEGQDPASSLAVLEEVEMEDVITASVTIARVWD